MTASENQTAKDQYNQSANEQNALFFQLVKEIPVFGATTPHIQDRLDDLLKTLDSNDIDTALNFGDFVQQDRNAVVNRLEAEHEAQNFSFIREPLQAALNTVKDMDIEGMGAKLENLMSKGTAIAGRNPGLLAATAAAAFLVTPFALLGGAGAIALKEKARNMRQKTQPETLESLEGKLRDGIIRFKPLVRGLEDAQQSLPAMRRSVQELGRANQNVIINVTLCIAAGREKLRRIAADEMPACTDNELQAQSLKNYSTTLAQNITILEDVRTKSIIDVSLLASSMQTVNNNEMTLRSILGNEILQHRSTLVAQAKVADSLRLSRTIEDFRKTTEGTTKTAIQATEAARQASLSNQVDSPERLQAALNSLNEVKKVLEKGITDLPKIENAKNILKGQIAGATTAVINAQLRTGTNDNQLGHTPSQTPAIGLDHKP